MKTLRIFISSPGDVKQERLIAKKVITELNQIYGSYIRIESILWEDLPLEATSSFQEGIDYFLNQAPIDIAVFILWSRLGSTLGHSYRKRDGSEYLSGTEYEYDTMYELWQQTGHPKIMVYVKDAEPQYGQGLSHSEIKESLLQQERLNYFIEEKFRDRETGTNYAYWQFDKQTTFEERLKTHLSRLVRDHIGRDVVIQEWEGNPYRGLQSFGIDESIIFCGRRDLAYEVLSRLIPTTETDEVRSLMVLGESGSGKSSFVMAGLVPLIYSNDSTLLRDKVIKVVPSDFHGNLYSGIHGILGKMFAALIGNPAYENLRNGIPDNYDYQYLQYALRSANSADSPTLVIDQFEEIFSDNAISEDERLRSLALLNIMVQTARVRVAIVMRNDFYSKFTSYQSLGAIKSSSVVVDIPNVSVDALHEIIEEPARKANLTWEVNDKGQALSKVVVKDAAKVGSLPLIEFALSELYNNCSDSRRMTFEAYEKIGRIEGAVAQYADRFYSSLNDDEKKIFGDLLSSVVTVARDDETKFVRKTTVRSAMELSPQHKHLVKKLIDAHLFVSGKDAAGEATVTIAHEILISSWRVVSDWTQNEKAFIKQNDYYERLAKHWEANGRKKNDLIQERSALLEVEYFMFKYEPRLHNPTLDFLRDSLLTQRRKGLVKYILGFVFIALIALCGVIMVMAGTSGDGDMDKTIDLDNLTLSSYICMVLPLLIVMGNSLWLRIRPRYKYRTIKRTAILWIAVVVFLSAVAVYEQIAGVCEWWVSLIYLAPYLICLISILIEWHRRKLWRKSIFKPFILGDKIERTKEIVTASVIVLVVISTLAIYTAVIYDKNEKYENTLAVADELFVGFNNIHNQLSWSDNLYINEKRKKYLEEGFSDEIFDKTPDKRDMEYALCLYNIREPQKAILHLNPEHYWKDHLLYIYCASEAGYTATCDKALEQYVESGRNDEIGYINAQNLVWVAEKLGRFDLAEKIYNNWDSIGLEWRITPSSLINRGHIDLMNGDVQQAKHYYDKAINLSPQYSGFDVIMRTSLEQDLLTFQWFGIGNPDMLDFVRSIYGFDNRHFYTTADNSQESTSEAIGHLAGSWVNADSTLTLRYSVNPPLCQYKVFDNGSEQNRIMVQLRAAEVDGHLYLEEFDPNNYVFAISTGEILPGSGDDELLIRVIENGNPDDRNTVRRFTRLQDYITSD